MKKLILVLFLTTQLIGCAMQLPPKDIQQAITLIQSASADLSVHNLKLSRQRLGELLAELEILESNNNADKDALRALKERVALESENVEALKELPLALEDLKLWSKGE